MISGPPLVMGDKLIVQSEAGNIAAFTVRLPERPDDDEATVGDEEG